MVVQTPAAMARIHQRLRSVRVQGQIEDQGSWPLLRSPLILYCIILGTILPLHWLSEAQLATGMLVVQAIHALIISGWIWPQRQEVLGLLRPTPSVLRMGGIGVLAWLGIAAIGVVYFHLVTRILHLPLLEPDQEFRIAGYPGWVAWCSIALLPAIWEELAFRGLIQGALAKLLRPTEAVVVTALIFAIIHRMPLSFPYLALLGLLLGLLRQRSGSLLPGMLVHLVNNTAAMFHLM